MLWLLSLEPPGADVRYGNAIEGDVILTYEGNDTAYGYGGDDLIMLYAGNDKSYGGYDRDTIYGDDQSDTLYGEQGDDVLYGDNWKTDVVAGADSIVGGDGNDDMWGFGGNDSIVGGLGNDSADGGDGVDYFFINAPNDGSTSYYLSGSFYYFNGPDGADRINANFERVYFNDWTWIPV